MKGKHENILYFRAIIGYKKETLKHRKKKDEDIVKKNTTCKEKGKRQCIDKMDGDRWPKIP
jgi:hypothetical protein